MYISALFDSVKWKNDTIYTKLKQIGVSLYKIGSELNLSRLTEDGQELRMNNSEFDKLANLLKEELLEGSIKLLTDKSKRSLLILPGTIVPFKEVVVPVPVPLIKEFDRLQNIFDKDIDNIKKAICIKSSVMSIDIICPGSSYVKDIITVNNNLQRNKIDIQFEQPDYGHGNIDIMQIGLIKDIIQPYLHGNGIIIFPKQDNRRNRILLYGDNTLDTKNLISIW